MANNANPAGAGPMRLDPYKAPHQVELGDKSYKVDVRGAVFRKVLSCGLPVNLALPNKAFKGVAARAIEDAQGNVAVTLELHHHDPELCIPLLVADNFDDVAADWHSWSRLMKLPMLIINPDELATSVRNMLGEIMVETPWERRKRITTVKHRPNFLRRRKIGVVGEVVKLTAADIIARR